MENQKLDLCHFPRQCTLCETGGSPWVSLLVFRAVPLSQWFLRAQQPAGNHLMVALGWATQMSRPALFNPSRTADSLQSLPKSAQLSFHKIIYTRQRVKNDFFSLLAPEDGSITSPRNIGNQSRKDVTSYLRIPECAARIFSSISCCLPVILSHVFPFFLRRLFLVTLSGGGVNADSCFQACDIIHFYRYVRY
jgi:hypothetical protein